MTGRSLFHDLRDPGLSAVMEVGRFMSMGNQQFRGVVHRAAPANPKVLGGEEQVLTI